MKTARRFVFISSLFLSACASGSATPYDQAASVFLANQFGGSSSGFEMEMLGADTWRVTFEGNTATTEDTAQSYGLYRCAVIALEHGYDGFEILSQIRLDSPSDTPYERMPGGGAGAGTAIGAIAVGGAAGALVGAAIESAPGTPYPVFSSEIRLVRRPLTGQPPKVFDATYIKQTLEPYVAGKKCDKGNICPHDPSYLRANPEMSGSAAR